MIPASLLTIALWQASAGADKAGWLSWTPTPTVDRLAEPTLPANPRQADRGAQDYWLYCMPCHGDRGQGLTDEFRDLYPPEDRGCWNAGCHGERPYENGWTLPPTVPRIIGPDALTSFPTAATLQAFIQVAMPWHAPGSLDGETYWRLTAFLLRENGVTLGPEPLGPENAAQVRIGSPSIDGPVETRPAPGSQRAAPTPTTSLIHPSVDRSPAPGERLLGFVIALGAGLLALGILGVWVASRRADRP